MEWTWGRGNFRFVIKENTYWALRHYHCQYISKKKKKWTLHCLHATRQKTRFELWEDGGVGWSEGIRRFHIPDLFREGSQYLSLKQDWPQYALVLQASSVDSDWVLRVSGLTLWLLLFPCPVGTQQFHANSVLTHSVKRFCHCAPLPWLAIRKHWLVTVKINYLGQWFSTVAAHKTQKDMIFYPIQLVV